MIGGGEVRVGGEEATIRDGASDGGGSAKGYYAEHLARQLKLPLVRLHEGAGDSVQIPAATRNDHWRGKRCHRWTTC